VTGLKRKLCPILNKECVGEECEWWITSTPDEERFFDDDYIPMASDCAMINIVMNLLDLDYRNMRVIKELKK